MSWDISIVDPKTGDPLELDFKHDFKGGVYCIGGSSELTLNVTYNYGRYFDFKLLNNNPLKMGIERLRYVYCHLNGPASEDYWETCPGNARRAIADLIEMAQFAEEDSIWKVE